MSLAIVQSRAEQGISAQEVSVEVHLTGGLPRFSIVGLPEAAVRESRDRVRSALISSNFDFPRKKITVNLAPADLPKEGGRYDLPIAIGILAAAGVIPQSSLEGKVFMGELALTGALRKTRGALIMALSLRNDNLKLCLPRDSSEEACVVPDVTLLPASHLLEVIEGLTGRSEFRHVDTPGSGTIVLSKDMTDVKGQAYAKWALTIAAAGGHNVLILWSIVSS
jgi:magnesium chelatase family protein